MKLSLLLAVLLSALGGGVFGAWLVESGHLADDAPQLGTTSTPPTQSVEPAAPPQQVMPALSYANAVKMAANAVVSIYTSDAANRAARESDRDYQDFYAESDPRASGIGSGVVISEDGFIITNYHVIRGAGQVYIGSPREHNPTAEVMGTDPETDLALLKVELENPHPIVFADSDDLENGDVVLAIGNPFGVGKTVTMGIVSALGRKDVGISTYERFIQTDAAINPGNSGGALVNTRGELVGINTAIVSNSGSYQGIAFAVPSNQVRDIIELLRTQGRVVRGWLGVSIHTAHIEEDKRDYAEVVGLFKDGPAEDAGLAPGDLILSINDKEVADSSVAIDLIARIAPGEPIRMSIARDGELREITAISAERPSLAE